MLTVANTAAVPLDVARTGLLKKTNAHWSTTAVSATIAGAAIGLAFVFYLITQMGAGELPFGVARLIGGLVFSGGLFVVIVTGADLFTSTSMTPMLLLDRSLTVARLLRHWAAVYLFNMAGAGLLVALIFFSGMARMNGGEWGAIVLSTAATKVAHPWSEAFFLGVMCNVLVCLGVWVAYHGRSVVDTFVSVLFPIALFVAAGFEHSVANMFIIPMALALKAQADPTIMQALSGTDLADLTWGSYLTANLVPVSLGNIVGAVLVAVGFWAWHRRAKPEAPAATL